MCVRYRTYDVHPVVLYEGEGCLDRCRQRFDDLLENTVMYMITKIPTPSELATRADSQYRILVQKEIDFLTTGQCWPSSIRGTLERINNHTRAAKQLGAASAKDVIEFIDSEIETAVKTLGPLLQLKMVSEASAMIFEWADHRKLPVTQPRE